MGTDLVQITPSQTPVLESLTSGVTSRAIPRVASGREKTFYIETFGCQMNVHDSEKVAGVLIARGYRPVSSYEEADLILYNTCTILEGCDEDCAYCVVPMTRGPERSRPSDKILAECKRLVDAGYTEIQFLGQNVNSYADPSAARLSFAELLARTAEIEGMRRVRFTTSHPRDFGTEIVRAIESYPALCDHVHLPVQSASSRVLGR